MGPEATALAFRVSNDRLNQICLFIMKHLDSSGLQGHYYSVFPGSKPSEVRFSFCAPHLRNEPHQYPKTVRSFKSWLITLLLLLGIYNKLDTYL